MQAHTDQRFEQALVAGADTHGHGRVGHQILMGWNA
jgi:hypothetical protein